MKIKFFLLLIFILSTSVLALIDSNSGINYNFNLYVDKEYTGSECIDRETKIKINYNLEVDKAGGKQSIPLSCNDICKNKPNGYTCGSNKICENEKCVETKICETNCLSNDGLTSFNEGEKECVNNQGERTCQKVNDCLQWSDFTRCSEGCEGNRCKSPPQPDCPNDGRCGFLLTEVIGKVQCMNNNKARVCDKRGTDSCPKWYYFDCQYGCNFVTDDCKCQTSCDDQNACTTDSCSNGGCVNSKKPEGSSCPGGACSNGQCVQTCTSSNCNDNNPCTIDSCENGDCTHTPLNEYSLCPGGKCFNENCVQCQDDCITGAKDCNGQGFRTCGLFDDDPCFDWQQTACGAIETCVNGACECVPNCAGKECGPDGCGGTCTPGCQGSVVCNNGACTCTDSKDDNTVCGTRKCGTAVDDCGRPRSCGSCGTGKQCDKGKCVDIQILEGKPGEWVEILPQAQLECSINSGELGNCNFNYFDIISSVQLKCNREDTTLTSLEIINDEGQKFSLTQNSASSNLFKPNTKVDLSGKWTITGSCFYGGYVPLNAEVEKTIDEGSLELVLEAPDKVKVNQQFRVSLTAKCNDGTCGKVEPKLKYQKLLAFDETSSSTNPKVTSSFLDSCFDPLKTTCTKSWQTSATQEGSIVLRADFSDTESNKETIEVQTAPILKLYTQDCKEIIDKDTFDNIRKKAKLSVKLKPKHDVEDDAYMIKSGKYYACGAVAADEVTGICEGSGKKCLDRGRPISDNVVSCYGEGSSADIDFDGVDEVCGNCNGDCNILDSSLKCSKGAVKLCTKTSGTCSLTGIQTCSNNAWGECTAQDPGGCTGKSCGVDSCGRSCGSCESDENCFNYQCYERTPGTLDDCSANCNNPVSDCPCASKCRKTSAKINENCGGDNDGKTPLDDCDRSCIDIDGCTCPNGCKNTETGNGQNCGGTDGVEVEADDCDKSCNDLDGCTCKQQCRKNKANKNENCGGVDDGKDTLTGCSDTCFDLDGCLCPQGCKETEVDNGENCGGTDGTKTPIDNCDSNCQDLDGCTCKEECRNDDADNGQNCGGTSGGKTPIDDCDTNCQDPDGCTCPSSCLNTEADQGENCGGTDGTKTPIDDCFVACPDVDGCICKEECKNEEADKDATCGGLNLPTDLTRCDTLCQNDAGCNCPDNCEKDTVAKGEACGKTILEECTSCDGNFQFGCTCPEKCSFLDIPGNGNCGGEKPPVWIDCDEICDSHKCQCSYPCAKEFVNRGEKCGLIDSCEDTCLNSNRCSCPTECTSFSAGPGETCGGTPPELGDCFGICDGISLCSCKPECERSEVSEGSSCSKIPLDNCDSTCQSFTGCTCDSSCVKTEAAKSSTCGGIDTPDQLGSCSQPCQDDLGCICPSGCSLSTTTKGNDCGGTDGVRGVPSDCITKCQDYDGCDCKDHCNSDLVNYFEWCGGESTKPILNNCLANCEDDRGCFCSSVCVKSSTDKGSNCGGVKTIPTIDCNTLCNDASGCYCKSECVKRYVNNGETCPGIILTDCNMDCGKTRCDCADNCKLTNVPYGRNCGGVHTDGGGKQPDEPDCAEGVALCEGKVNCAEVEQLDSRCNPSRIKCSCITACNVANLQISSGIQKHCIQGRTFTPLNQESVSSCSIVGSSCSGVSRYCDGSKCRTAHPFCREANPLPDRWYCALNYQGSDWLCDNARQCTMPIAISQRRTGMSLAKGDNFYVSESEYAPYFNQERYIIGIG